MKKRRYFKRAMSLLLGFGLITGLLPLKTVGAAEYKVGFGYRDGKLFSVELKEGQAKIKEVTKETPAKTSDSNVIIVSKREGENLLYYVASKAGEILSDGYDLIDPFKEGRARVGVLKGKENMEEDPFNYGFVDENGKLVTEVKYSWVNDFANGRATVFLSNEKGWFTGAIDRNGKEVIPPKYDFVGSFNSEGLAIFHQEVGNEIKKGLINQDGKIVIKPEYFMIEEVFESKIYKTSLGNWDYALYGLINHKGEVIAEAKYQNFLNIENEKLFVLYSNDDEKKKYEAGVVDYEGKVIVPFDATMVSELWKDAFFVRKGLGADARFGLIHKSGKLLRDFNLWTYDNFDFGLARVSTGEDYTHWGLIDQNGKEVLPFSYSFIYPFSDGLAFMENEKGELWFASQEGKLAFKLDKRFDAATEFHEGLCTVREKKSKKWGYINKKGKLVIPCKFEDADLFINGTARIYKIDRLGNYISGLIDKKGKIIQPVRYSKIEYQDSGAIKVAIKDSNNFEKFGYLDRKGKVILPPKYDYAFDNYGKETIVSIVLPSGEEKFGLADKSGKLDKTIKYDQIYTPYKGMYKTVMNVKDGSTKNGMIDGNGKELLKPIYDEIENFNNLNDLAIIKNKSKKGLVNTKGKIILPLRYDEIYITKEGASIHNVFSDYNRKSGFVNRKGKIILKPVFDNLYVMENGFIAVTKDGKNGIYNVAGKLIIPVKYDFIEYFNERGLAIAGKNKLGLINNKGKTIIPFVYDEIIDLLDGNYKVIKDGKTGILDFTGKTVVPVEFHDILF